MNDMCPCGIARGDCEYHRPEFQEAGAKLPARALVSDGLGWHPLTFTGAFLRRHYAKDRS